MTGSGVVMVLTEEGRRVTHESIKDGFFSTLPLEAGRYVVRVEVLYTPELERPSFPSRVVEVPEGGRVLVNFEAPGAGADLAVLSAERVDHYLLLPGSWPLPDTRERYLASRNASHGCMTNIAGPPPHPCTFELLPAGRYTLLVVRDEDARPLELHREEVVVPDSGTLELVLQPRWRPGPDVPPQQ